MSRYSNCRLHHGEIHRFRFALPPPPGPPPPHPFNKTELTDNKRVCVYSIQFGKIHIWPMYSGFFLFTYTICLKKEYTHGESKSGEILPVGMETFGIFVNLNLLPYIYGISR